MRRAMWTVAALAVASAAYCGAWWIASERSRAAIVAWIEGLPADRVVLAPGEMRRGGFPFSVRWTFEAPRIEARWALGEVSARAASLSLWVDFWRPGTIRYSAASVDSGARHDPTRRAWRLVAGSLAGQAETNAGGGYDLLYEAADLDLEEIGFRGSATAPRAVAEIRAVSGSLRGPIGPDATDEHAARLVLRGIEVPDARALLSSSTGSAEAWLTLRGPLGDGSIEDLVAWRDASGVLEIERLDVEWMPLDLAFDGTFAFDEQLRPLGAGTADIRGLNGLIDGLVAKGVVKPGEATVAKLALALLTRPAKDGGEPVVRLPLTAQDGVLRAGPFVLGRLPPLVR